MSIASELAGVALSMPADRFRRVRFDMGSKKIVLGDGARIVPMSTLLTSVTFLSHEVVGDIDVGRVSVAVMM